VGPYYGTSSLNHVNGSITQIPIHRHVNDAVKYANALDISRATFQRDSRLGADDEDARQQGLGDGAFGMRPTERTGG